MEGVDLLGIVAWSADVEGGTIVRIDQLKLVAITDWNKRSSSTRVMRLTNSKFGREVLALQSYTMLQVSNRSILVLPCG